jgi:hypothetical protein
VLEEFPIAGQEFPLAIGHEGHGIPAHLRRHVRSRSRLDMCPRSYRSIFQPYHSHFLPQRGCKFWRCFSQKKQERLLDAPAHSTCYYSLGGSAGVGCGAGCGASCVASCAFGRLFRNRSCGSGFVGGFTTDGADGRCGVGTTLNSLGAPETHAACCCGVLLTLNNPQVPAVNSPTGKLLYR